MPRPRVAFASGLALAYALALLGDQMLYVVLPSNPEAAGITAASLGIVLSANRFVRLVANSLSGALSDRLGRRRPYLLGMALALASTAGYLGADGVWSLVVWRVVWGIAFALISVGGAAIMLDLSSHADRGRTIGTYQSLLQLGTLLGLLLSGFLADALGYRGTLMVYAPLAAVGLAVAAAVLKRRPTSDARDDGPPERRATGVGALAALRTIEPRLLVPASVTFASRFTGGGILMATLGIYLKQLATAPGAGRWLVPVASLTGVLLAASRLAGMIEAPIAGHALDRLGDRRTVAGAGIALTVVGFAVLAAGAGVGAVVAGVGLVAAGEGFLYPAVVVWTGDHAPAHLRGAVMGGLATAGDLGAALGPLVGYALLEGAGLRAAFALCAALMMSALVALVVVCEAGVRREIAS